MSITNIEIASQFGLYAARVSAYYIESPTCKIIFYIEIVSCFPETTAKLLECIYSKISLSEV